MKKLKKKTKETSMQETASKIICVLYAYVTKEAFFEPKNAEHTSSVLMYL